MFGAGLMSSMQASFKSNRDAIKNPNRFRERAKELRTRHIGTSDKIHFTTEEMHRFKQKLRIDRKKDSWILVVTFVAIAFFLIILIALLNRSLSFDVINWISGE